MLSICPAICVLFTKVPLYLYEAFKRVLFIPYSDNLAIA